MRYYADFVGEPILVSNATEGQQDSFSWDAEAYSEKTVKESLIQVRAETTDLARAHHFDPKHRVCTHQSRE